MKDSHRLCPTILILAAFSFCTWLPADEPTSALPQIGGEAYQLLTRLYEYDSTIPLEARTVEIKEIDGLPREKIVLRTTQGFLVPGYLQIPAAGMAPYSCVLLLHGWSGSKDSWYRNFNYYGGHHKLTPEFVPHAVEWIATHLGN